MNDCPFCGHALNTDGTSECPQCGRSAETPLPAPMKSKSFIHKYVSDLWKILTRPTSFFRTMPVTGGVSGPLAFALITHWLGASVDFLWRTWIGGALGGYFNNFFQVAGDVADVDHPGRSAVMYEMRDRILHWIWGAGSVIADPFFTLASILFTSLFVFAGARILVTPGKNGAPQQITYESALRIICFGMSPAILAVLPIAGPVVAGICVAIVTVIGAREVYRISYGRAVIVALFPKILFLGILLLGLLFVAVVVFKIFASAF